MKNKGLERLVFLGLVALVFSWAGWEAVSFPPRARIFPQTVAFAALALALIEIARTLIARRRGRAEAMPTAEQKGESKRPTLHEQVVAGAPYVLWIAAYYVGIYLVGFLVASGMFVFLFLNRVGRVRWLAALGATAPLLAAMLAIGAAMNLSWPTGLISNWLDFLAR
jgi:asparagine N-glycosylation enzyme membrane subunit Stt3